MEIVKEVFEDKSDFFTIKVNDLTFTFSDIGASLYSLYYGDDPLILEVKNKNLFLTSPQYFNKTLGEIAGRIPSSFNLFDKEFHFLDTGNNISLHGGDNKSLSYKRWKYKIKEYKNKIEVKFFINTKRIKKDLFFAKNKIYVIYDLYKNKNGFKIKFKVNVKEDTFLNLSNHIYWNLAKSLTIDDYKLKFNASKIGKVDENLLIIDTISTPAYLDFKRKTLLKSRLDKADKTSIGTIDNTFIFDDKINKVSLENDSYKVKMKTNYEAMNIYCDSSMTNVLFNNRDDLKSRRGIALEPQKYVYDLASLYYKKGDNYNYYIEYIIDKK